MLWNTTKENVEINGNHDAAEAVDLESKHRSFCCTSLPFPLAQYCRTLPDSAFEQHGLFDDVGDTFITRRFGLVWCFLAGNWYQVEFRVFASSCSPHFLA